MKISCRIKRFLGIQSPAPYRYCKLNLNPRNKKRCKNCKYFKTSEYYAYDVFKGLERGLAKGVKAMDDFNKALRDSLRGMKQ